MPSHSQLPELPLMLAGIPGPVAELLCAAGLPVAPMPCIPLLAGGSGRFVLFDSRQSGSLAQARRAESQGLTALDLNDLACGAEWPEFETLDGSAACHCARVFLERLMQELEARGGVWLRVADVPFPYQSALALGLEHDSEELDGYQSLAAALPGQITHFVSTRVRGEALAPLIAGPRVDLGWHVLPDDFELSRRSTLSHWTTRIARFREAGLAIAGLSLAETDRPLPSDAALLKLGLRYGCRQGRGKTSPILPAGGIECSAWVRLATQPLPGRHDFVEWIGEHYQSGCPLLMTAEAARSELVHDLLALSADAARCSLLWQTSLGEFARWWQSRRRLRIEVWRRNAGCEIHVDGDLGTFTWGLELWRGHHMATVPLKSPELHVPDDGLVYLRSPKKNPGGCTIPGDSVLKLTANHRRPAAA